MAGPPAAVVVQETRARTRCCYRRSRQSSPPDAARVRSAVPTRERSTSATCDVLVSDRLLPPSVTSWARLRMREVVRMTGTVTAPITPIVPGAGRRGETRRAPASRATRRSQPPLPLVTLPTPREGSTVYGMTALDRHGRLAD